MKFSEKELHTLERVLEEISLDECVSDVLYRNYAAIVRRINEDIQRDKSEPTQRRIRTLPLTKD